MTRGEDFQDFWKMSKMVEFIWFMFVHYQILIGDTLNSLLNVSTGPKYYFYSVVVKTSSFDFKVKPRPEVESRQRPEEGRVWVSTRSEEGLNDSVLNMLSFRVMNSGFTSVSSEHLQHTQMTCASQHKPQNISAVLRQDSVSSLSQDQVQMLSESMTGQVKPLCVWQDQDNKKFDLRLLIMIPKLIFKVIPKLISVYLGRFPSQNTWIFPVTLHGPSSVTRGLENWRISE